MIRTLKQNFKFRLFYILSILLVVSSSCLRDRIIPGITVEATGVVYTDSTKTNEIPNQEVVLFEYESNYLSLALYGLWYWPIDTSITDNEGNYSFEWTTEDNTGYAVWPQPDIFKYASGEPVIINKREGNEVDLSYVTPTIVNLEIKLDSLTRNANSHAFEYVLDLVIEQLFELEGVVSYCSNDFCSFGFTITADTTISLHLGPGTTVEAYLSTPQDLFATYPLEWNNSREYMSPKSPDTMTVIMTRA